MQSDRHFGWPELPQIAREAHGPLSVIREYKNICFIILDIIWAHYPVVLHLTLQRDQKGDKIHRCKNV